MAAPKARGLGKGLDGLIPNMVGETKPKKEAQATEVEDKGPETIVKITMVEPNREQPRKNFDEDALQELADSIKQFGLLQPILVQDRKDHYEIIAGERRWRACKIAGLKEIPVIIKNYTEKEILEISIIENIQREDLNPIEEALGYKRLLTEFGLKQDEVAERVSKSRAAVTNSIRLLKLSERVQQMVIDDKISTGHARALLAIENEEEQYSKIGRIIEQIRQETGREIVYNVCRWQFPGEWVTQVADSWRTGADIEPNFSSVLRQIDNIKPLARFCGPGHVNDLDMMQIGNGLSEDEEKTHFAMWCMMSSPLIIGCDLTKISEKTLGILKNREMIAINQDIACQQAFLTKQVYSKSEISDTPIGEVWLKNLGKQQSEKKAVAFLNRSNEEINIHATIAELGLQGDVSYVRDVWAHEDLKPTQEYSVALPAHGVVVYVINALQCGKEVKLYEE